MKRLIVVASCAIVTNAMAIDFDTEWSKFSNDFVKIRSTHVAKLERTPVENKAVVVTPLPEKNPSSELVQVDPKSPERLGHQLSDPAVKEYVTKLYQKPDVVVYSATIR
jgi:transcription initiation factor TFIIIB Brf1 subunit/transcription initiation factor TFIIB